MDDLLARLKMPQSASGSSNAQDTLPPSTASLQQPQPQTPPHVANVNQPPFSATRPGGAPAVSDRASSDRAANLLNLLKFNSSPAPKQSIGSPIPDSSAGDFGSSSPAIPVHSRTASSPTAQQPISHKPTSPLPAHSNPQDALLSLLNRTQLNTTSPALEASEGVLKLGTSRDSIAPVKQSFDATESSGHVDRSSATSAAFFANQIAPALPASQVPKPDDQPIEISTQNSSNTRSSNVVSYNERSLKSPEPAHLPDGRTRVEAIIGIGAPPQTGTESVASAVDDVRQQANREAQDALAKAGPAGSKPVHAATSSLKFENTPASHSPPATASPTKLADEASAAVSTETTEDAPVKVYNFPMRPFVSINIKDGPPSSTSIRSEIVMKIASLKKEFDQVDRSLVTATTNFIVYALVKGGVRVIRQDDGSNQQIFKKHGEQMFNLSVRASGKPNESEYILATAVNGSVYCTTAPAASDSFEKQNMDDKSFIFPPLPSNDENTSGGQLKTRAKQASRDPEIFAIGRGKSIHIIHATMAVDSQFIDGRTRIVNSEKYLSERCLKIATGKAGKDFTFSDDDSVIVSLDKAGRLKFWDIRPHLDAARDSSVGPSLSVEVKSPTMILETSAPTDKSWATSVQFVDKEKPFTKMAAIRYLLVGLKQNHTLQLWDLCLGKPVQELNLPHENETDAICSIGYHSKSGIVVIGHPTRNSIYLVHLSAPRYNLPAMSQAEFTRRLVSEDQKSLPRLESTAIMSGVRELSFAGIGQLRSLEVLQPAVSNESDKDDETVFEIYVMHSKGVGCLGIRRRDLGWDRDGKVVDPMDGEKEQFLSVKPLQILDQHSEVKEYSDPGSGTQKSAKPEVMTLPLRPSLSTSAPIAHPSLLVDVQETRHTSSNSSSEPPAEKGKKKRNDNLGRSNELSKSATPETYAAAIQKNAAQSVTKPASAVNTPVNTTEQAKVTLDPSKEEIKATSLATPNFDLGNPSFANMLGETLSNAIGTTLSAVFAEVLTDQLQGLYERIDKSRRVHDATAAANQEALLRLVSSTLTENTEKSLVRIINSGLKDSVMPNLSKSLSTTLEQKVSKTIEAQLSSSVSREVKAATPVALSKALKDADLQRHLTESINNKLASHMDKEFKASWSNTVSPVFQSLASKTAQNVTTAVEKSVKDQLKTIEIKSTESYEKTDQLVELIAQLSGTIQTMATAQLELRNEFAKLQAEIATLRASNASEHLPVTVQTSSLGSEDGEVANIATLFSNGQMEEATIQWLSSSRQEEIWKLLLVNMDPVFLKELNQIVVLSVAAAISTSFESDVSLRMTWLELCLESLDTQNTDLHEYAPKIMEVLTSRLQDTYMQISQSSPSEPVLAKIHTLVRKARDIKQMIPVS